jgi:conjugal transfer pilus assembly protein TraW
VAYLLILLSLLLSSHDLFAANLGVHGELFPVVEENLLERIRSKADCGIPEMVLDKLVALVEEPRVHRRLPNAVNSRSFEFDPSIVLKRDIPDGSGGVLYRRGHRLNPLDLVDLAAPLLFFNGSEESHLSWAREEHSGSKWILVAGSPLGLAEQEAREVYFDQGGYLVHKFGIEALPARVSQKKKILLIEEIELKEKRT